MADVDVVEIPLAGYPEQFEADIGDKTYLFRVRWNDQLSRWTLDLGNSEDDWLISSLPLVPGQDLLWQYGYMALGFQLYFQCDTDEEAEAAYSDIEDGKAHLYAVIEDDDE